MDNIVNYNEFFKLLKNYTHIFYKNLLQRYNDNPKYFEFIYLILDSKCSSFFLAI